MVGVAALLAEAQSAGLKLRADGDRLVIRGRREHEHIAKALLAHRAAIPASWIAGVAKLTSMTPQAGVSSERWTVLIADAGSFLEKWAGQAARLGWTATDVFGVNAIKPFVRVDGAGLIRLLDGREVVALIENEIVIACPPGPPQTFRRKADGVVTAKRCLLWELSGGER